MKGQKHSGWDPQKSRTFQCRLCYSHQLCVLGQVTWLPWDSVYAQIKWENGTNWSGRSLPVLMFHELFTWFEYYHKHTTRTHTHTPHLYSPCVVPMWFLLTLAWLSHQITLLFLFSAFCEKSRAHVFFIPGTQSLAHCLPHNYCAKNIMYTEKVEIHSVTRMWRIRIIVVLVGIKKTSVGVEKRVRPRIAEGVWRLRWDSGVTIA